MGMRLAPVTIIYWWCSSVCSVNFYGKNNFNHPGGRVDLKNNYYLFERLEVKFWHLKIYYLIYYLSHVWVSQSIFLSSEQSPWHWVIWWNWSIKLDRLISYFIEGGLLGSILLDILDIHISMFYTFIYVTHSFRCLLSGISEIK